MDFEVSAFSSDECRDLDHGTDVQGLHSIDSIDGVNMHLQDVPPFLDEDRFERQEFEGMTRQG